jgi:hypothetical protein
MFQSQNGKKRGNAFFALPLLFLAAQLPAGPKVYDNRPKSNASAQNAGGLEAQWLVLSINRDALNEAANQAGAPGYSGSSLQLIGAGGVIYSEQARYSVFGVTGGMGSESGTNTSNWNLDLVGLYAEQRYPANSWEVLAGFYAGYGQFAYEIRDPLGYSRFESRFPASGATAGFHWPRDSRLSFTLRSGYLWLPAAGAWHGPRAPQIAKTYFDLSAAFGQVGMELLF